MAKVFFSRSQYVFSVVSKSNLLFDFCFFVIGAWGDLRSNEGGVDSALLVSVTSFIFGSVVNIIDDFVSAVFVCFFSKKEMK